MTTWQGRAPPTGSTRADVVAINTTMRARSAHSHWEPFTKAAEALPWLAVLDPSWDLVLLDDDVWQTQARPNAERGLNALVGPGRGLSVATKVLHLKRPSLYPVLDSLVLQQLGVTESVSPISAIDHLRAEGQRNRDALLAIQGMLAETHRRSLVRIMDALLWTSHPASGLSPMLPGWEHVVRPALPRVE